jgi:peptidyl-prolyl cis-trans isomerase C
MHWLSKWLVQVVPSRLTYEAQIKEEVIAREIFMQEARKRGLDATDDYQGPT